MNAKLFQIRLLKRVLKRVLKREMKKGVMDRDPRRKPDSRTCERKALSERDLCMCILEMRAEAMLKPCMGQSAQIAQWEQNITSQCADPDCDWEGVCNARSSNHDPNHEADRDPKRLSERDLFLCEHSQQLTILKVAVP